MFQASHKQWEVPILILINTSASIKLKNVKLDNWLNLKKRPCWESIPDAFASEAKPYTAGLHSLYSLLASFLHWDLKILKTLSAHTTS